MSFWKSKVVVVMMLEQKCRLRLFNNISFILCFLVCSTPVVKFKVSFLLSFIWSKQNYNFLCL